MNESAQWVFRSVIWEFFDRGASDATCHTCKMRLKTPTGTTTTLVNHLKRHPDPFKQFEKLRAAESSKKPAGLKKTTGTNKADASAASCSYFKPTLKGDSQRAITLTTKVAQFLATGLHSYLIVEELGFLSLMHTAVPEYKVPSRTMFSRSVVPELYAKEKERIKSELRHHFTDRTPCYSVTTDGWTSRPGDSYVSFTCHLVDKEFWLHNYHLAWRHMPEGHTSDNLKRILLDLAKEWGLPQDVPVFIVTDNARNFLGATSRTGWCAKKGTQNFEQLCVKARAIVGHYKRSSQARNHLKEVQQQQRCGEESAFAGNLLHSMKSRFVDIKLQVTYALSTALDPRFKAVCYDTTSEKRWLKNLLCSAVEKSLLQGRDSEEPSAPAQAVSSDVWDVFGALASTTTSSTGSQRLMEEVEEYLHAPVRPRLENPFLWWKNFGEYKYPSLSKLARLYLSVPATQVSRFSRAKKSLMPDTDEFSDCNELSDEVHKATSCASDAEDGEITFEEYALTRVRNKWVYFSKTAEENAAVNEGFLWHGAIPGIIGCVASSLIAIIAPKGGRKAAFKRCKENYALNCMFALFLFTFYLRSQICNGDMKILAVNPM
ncbi:uncharacterized protein [Dermacentor albipictus]|uniref:uncharacterized protein n=1 Tax=Dermacentor albipictus TaxID=60249 RepID=UPI0038FD0E4B